MLDAGFVEIIQKIAAEKGKDFFLETRKMKALLIDYTKNEFKKETSLLSAILDINAVKYINITENLPECKQTLINQMEENYNYSPKKSAEMLDLLFFVLRGVKIQKLYSPHYENNSIKDDIINNNKKEKKTRLARISKNKQSDGRTYNFYNSTVIIEGDKIVRKDNVDIKGDIIDSNIVKGNENRNTIKLNLPATVNKKQFDQILEVLEKYLGSEQAKKMKVKEKRTFQTEIDEVRKQGYKTGGWERIRKFISSIANLSVFATNFSVFLAAHPKIPEAIRLMFGGN